MAEAKCWHHGLRGGQPMGRSRAALGDVAEAALAAGGSKTPLKCL